MWEICGGRRKRWKHVSAERWCVFASLLPLAPLPQAQPAMNTDGTRAAVADPPVCPVTSSSSSSRRRPLLISDTGKIRSELIQWLIAGEGLFCSCLSVRCAMAVGLLHLRKSGHAEIPRCTKLMYWIFPLCLQPSLFCLLLSQLISTILAVKGPWEKGNQGVGWLFPI